MKYAIEESQYNEAMNIFNLNHVEPKIKLEMLKGILQRANKIHSTNASLDQALNEGTGVYNP